MQSTHTPHRSHLIFLFVYGTLRDAEIRAALLGRAVDSAAAHLEGWGRFVGEGGWIFIKPLPGETVAGALLALEAEDLPRLDAWEAVPFYQREELAVRRDGEEATVTAWVYTRRQAAGTPVTDQRLANHDKAAILRQIRGG